jgi:RNA polymerase primary sigma factor
VAFVGVRLTEDERKEYVATEQRLVDARHHLRGVPGMPLTPFGDFIAAVAHLADGDSGADGRAAREYLDVFSARRQIVARSSAKYELLGRLAPAIRDADGALLFTETVRGANHAVNRLDPLVDIELITGSTARRERKEILGDLRGRRLDVVAAPRVLDEGIDVPDADLGIVLSASRTRRQMIQRMGRILRRKGPKGRARFVIVFARDTLEDPAHRIERDGFVEEIERISEASGTFDPDRFADLDAFLAPAGPDVVPEPERLGRIEAALADARTPTGGPSQEAAGGPSDVEVVEAFATDVGVETAYAYLRFARYSAETLGAVAELELADRLPAPGPDAAPYLEVELTVLPEIGVPKATPKRLSTGASPLAIRHVADGFRLTCIGCGRSSRAVRFRWQVHEETVACGCD